MDGYVGQVRFSQHFREQMAAKGFTVEQIESCIRTPEKITNVSRYPGQKRYCGAGVAIVMRGDTAVTIYADSIVTPLRPDQMNDEAALNSSRLNLEK